MARGTSPHPRPKLGKAKFLHDFLGVPRGRNQSDASEWVAGVALSKRRPGIVSARVCRCVPRSKVHPGAPGATSAKISCAVAEQGRRQIAACDAQSCAWPEEPQITSQGINNYNCGSASAGIADFLPPGTADVQALTGKLLHLEAVFRTRTSDRTRQPWTHACRSTGHITGCGPAQAFCSQGSKRVQREDGAPRSSRADPPCFCLVGVIIPRLRITWHHRHHH